MTNNLKIRPIRYKADISGFEKHLKELHPKLQDVVDKVTLDAKALSQNYVPVDQGVAKASHYAVTSKGSDREEAINLAKEEALNQPSRWGNKGRTVEFSSEEQDLKDMHGFVCVAVIYALELEFGYVSGSLNVQAENPNAQRPFLTVAMDEMEPIFIAACTAVFKSLR